MLFGARVALRWNARIRMVQPYPSREEKARVYTGMNYRCSKDRLYCTVYLQEYLSKTRDDRYIKVVTLLLAVGDSITPRSSHKN